jgi:hypothetical protein
VCGASVSQEVYISIGLSCHTHIMHIDIHNNNGYVYKVCRDLISVENIRQEK